MIFVRQVSYGFKAKVESLPVEAPTPWELARRLVEMRAAGPVRLIFEEGYCQWPSPRAMAAVQPPKVSSELRLGRTTGGGALATNCETWDARTQTWRRPRRERY